MVERNYVHRVNQRILRTVQTDCILQQAFLLLHVHFSDRKLLFAGGDVGLGAINIRPGNRAQRDLVVGIIQEFLRGLGSVPPHPHFIVGRHQAPVEIQNTRDSIQQLRSKRLPCAANLFFSYGNETPVHRHAEALQKLMDNRDLYHGKHARVENVGCILFQIGFVSRNLYIAA